MIAIGIGGPPQAGKDTVANRLVDRWGFESKAFSELIVDEFKEEHGRIPSKGEMQIYGTMRRETKGDWYWIQQMAEWARSRTRIVLPGVRFPQELEWIQRQSHWALWRVQSDRKDTTGRDPDHICEHALDDFQGWSCIIRNDGEIDELHEMIDAALDAWGRAELGVPHK